MPQVVITDVMKREGTNEMMGWDGNSMYPLAGFMKSDDGEQHMAVGTDGRMHYYRPRPKGDGPLDYAWDATSRAMGIVLGTLNSPLALIWGTADAVNQRGDTEEFKERPFMSTVDAAFESAWKSISEKGGWGTTYIDYYKHTTGETVEDTFNRMAETEKDKGRSHNLYAAKKLVGSMSNTTVELLVSLMADPMVTVAGAASILRKSFAGKYPGFTKLPTYMTKHMRAQNAAVAKETARELQELSKNRQQLMNVLRAFNDNKQFLETNQRLYGEIEAEMAKHYNAASKATKEMAQSQAYRELGHKYPQMRGRFTRELGEHTPEELAALGLDEPAKIIDEGRPTLGKMEEAAPHRAPRPTRLKTTVGESPEYIDKRARLEHHLGKLPELRSDLDIAMRERQAAPAARAAALEEMNTVRADIGLEPVEDLTIDYVSRGEMHETAAKTAVVDDTLAVDAELLELREEFKKVLPEWEEVQAAKKRPKPEFDLEAEIAAEAKREGLGVEKVAPEDRVARMKATQAQLKKEKPAKVAKEKLADKAELSLEEKVAKREAELAKAEEMKQRTPTAGELDEAEKATRQADDAEFAKTRVQEPIVQPEKAKVSVPRGEMARVKAQVAAYEDALDFLDELSEEEAIVARERMVRTRKRLDDVDDGGVTMDFMGFTQMGRQIGKATKAGKNLWRRVRGFDTDPPSDQIEDIFELVEESLRDRYGAQFKPTKKSVLRDEANVQGLKLYGKHKLVHPDGTIEKFSSAKKLGERLGFSPEEVKELQRLNLQLSIEEGRNAFVEWAFPSGLRKVTAQDAWVAAQKFEKHMDKVGKQKRQILDPVMYTAEGILNRTPSGRKLFELTLGAKSEAERKLAGNWVDVQKAMRKHGIKKKADIEDLRMITDGFGDKVDNTAASAAAEEIRPILDDVHKRAAATEMETAKYREGYFPHKMLDIDELRKGGGQRKDVLEATVKEGIFKDTTEAAEHLDSFVARLEGNQGDMKFLRWLAKREGSMSKAMEIWEKHIVPHYNPVSGHLVKTRRGIPWYNRDFNSSILSYLTEAERSIANVKHLGRHKQIARGLVDRIMGEGGNYQMANKFLETYTNPKAHLGSEAVRKTANALTTYQSITKLNPLTTAVNLSQSMAVPLETSLKASLKAAHAYMFRGGKEFAERSGAVVSQTMRDILHAHGATGKLGTGYMKIIGFTKSEQVLRTFASNAGRFHVVEMAELLRKGKRIKYATRQLRKMGLDPDKVISRGYATVEETMIGGKRISRSTQFRGDIFDLPEWWTKTPQGRVVTQFKTFVYNQARMLNRTVVREAKKGNIRPLMWLLTAYPIVGAGYDTLIDQIILGKESPDSLPGWYWRGLTSIGGLGLWDSTYQSAKYGAGALAKNFLGPTLDEMATLVAGMGAFVDDPVTEVATGLGSRTPVVGRFVRKRMIEEKGGRGARPQR